MKIRNGFVSNSSSSSFVCDLCGEVYEGWDASPSDPSYECTECENGHVMCNEHLKDAKIEVRKTEACEHNFDRDKIKFCPECGTQAWDEEEVPSCPICNFEDYSNDEMAKYLEKTRKVSRDSVFAKIKAVNKRRRKLYEEEYVTAVCQEFSLTDDILLKEIKDKFSSFEKYGKFIWGR